MATTPQVRMTVLGTEPITADQLMEMHGKGLRGELIRGVFCEAMSAGITHGEIVVNVAGFLREVVRPNRLGRLIASDAGVKLESDPDTVREPDIAYFSRDRLPLDEDVPGYAEVPPNLVIEVSSPSDTPIALFDKARMWLNAGVDAVWILWPETRVVEVHRHDQPVQTLRESDTLTAADVLPQFSVPVAEIFNA